mgnify:CR=1 FL=1
MIELRSNVLGFYKGYIYCSCSEEAARISNSLNKHLLKNIGKEIQSKVKRGCSEYAIKYPEFDQIDKKRSSQMLYNKDWKVIEERFDKKNNIKTLPKIRSTLCGISLSDFLIIRNWMQYAQGIGDTSVKYITDEKLPKNNFFYQAYQRIKSVQNIL